ncbi:MAG: SDR family oxidoreductase [Candidatus Schekmanbacteria bacterium]|nr:SDR family oxidoreductase [Candidatus Schekmanbacteria bacterium]
MSCKAEADVGAPTAPAAAAALPSGASSPQRTDPAALAQSARDAAALLEAVIDDRGLLALLDRDLRRRLMEAAGRASKPDAAARRKLRKSLRHQESAAARQAERALVATTGIRKLRENPIFQTPRRGDANSAPGAALPPPLGEIREPRTCYVCRQPFTVVHFFYDQMCPTCGDFNYRKRDQRGDLRGRVALVTGGRVKIGFQAALMLLRSGCSVIVTTRFPRDAARRYAAEADFAAWAHRLEIHAIDLRHIPNVEALCAHLRARHARLDFLINNACQTVRRPPGFYQHLIAAELDPALRLDGPAALLLDPSASAGAVVLKNDNALPPAALSQIPLVSGDEARGEALFPLGALDADEQQVDLRTLSSWRLRMADVPTVELLEVHLVNAVAPYLLNARLKPLMLAVPTRDAHIVNVSAMEGQFYRSCKSDRHPHTNMAKAALNMMTRTAALDYVRDGIHMNSVDTGWVTDEDPAAIAAHKREMHDFSPPLDVVDGAARIVDPIFTGLAAGRHVWGQFLKDYKITDW